MEGISPGILLDIVKNFGAIGLLCFMWWMDSKSIRKILQQYKDDMAEMRQMYKNNVHLVEGYQALAKDLKDVVIMNTQTNTKLGKSIEDNQFCPMVRLEKKAKGVQAP